MPGVADEKAAVIEIAKSIETYSLINEILLCSKFVTI